MYLCLALFLLQVSSIKSFTELNDNTLDGNLEFPQMSILYWALEKICNSTFITSALCNTVVLCLFFVCCQQITRVLVNIKSSMVKCLSVLIKYFHIKYYSKRCLSHLLLQCIKYRKPLALVLVILQSKQKDDKHFLILCGGR